MIINAYQKLISNKNERAKFFKRYDRMIQRFKEVGLLETAMEHAKTRNELRDELSLLD